MRAIVIILISISAFSTVHGQTTKIYKTFNFLQFKPLDTLNYSVSKIIDVEIDSVEVRWDTTRNQISRIRLLKDDFLKNYYIFPRYRDNYIKLTFHYIHYEYDDGDSILVDLPVDCSRPEIFIVPNKYIYCNVGEDCDPWEQNQVYQIHKLDAQLRSKSTYIFSGHTRQLILMSHVSINGINHISISLHVPLKDLKVGSIKTRNYSNGQLPEFDFCEQLYFDLVNHVYPLRFHHIGYTDASSSYLLGWWEEN